MREYYESQLAKLNTEMHPDGHDGARTLISGAIQALLENTGRARRAVAFRAVEIDQYERDIERLCMRLAAPAARGDRSACGLFGAENDLRPGAHRRPGGGYRRHYQATRFVRGMLERWLSRRWQRQPLAW